MTTYFTGQQAEDRLLGNYRLLSVLGSGQYAAVYLGEHVYLKTQAAIKVLHTHLVGAELEVFLTEARALAHLVHPHIVRVLDFGVERGIPYLVMDFAPEGTLRQLHPPGTALTCANVLRYVKQIASALQYAHYHQVIHRDIKPDNMLVGRNNEVLLSDFGIAALAPGTGGQQRRRPEGNCAYMAPEQFRGQPCPASDQYALGIMAYEWLAGSRPFSGGEIEMMVQHQSTPPPSLRERAATIPPAVEQVVLQALAKQPEARFASVEAFAQALSRACGAVSAGALLPASPSQAQLAFQIGRAHHQPLVGREREWEALVHLLTSVELPQYALPSPISGGIPDRGLGCRCALLVGDLGIGKTRLAEDLSRETQRRGWNVAWGRGYAQESDIPYRVVMEIIQNLLHAGAWPVGEGDAGFVEAIPAPLRRFLPASRAPEPPETAAATALPQQERALLWVAVLDLFTKLSQRAPLLVVWDDLHWADESSIELLAYLIRHLADQRVLFVATYRQTELGCAHPLIALEPSLRYEQRAVKLTLAPLSEEQIAQLLSGLPLPRVQEIQVLAGGNPFFAEQLATGARDGDSRRARERSQASRGLSAIPGTILAALERRVGALSSACQQLLSVAAVLRGSFSHRILRDMMKADQQEEDRLLDLLDEAIGAGILVEEGARAAVSYYFSHPLVVTYLYERLSAIRRVYLHRAAADALLRCYQGREEEGAAAIAFHLVECGGEMSSIGRYAEMAADYAFRLSAYREAGRHYKLAVEHWEGGEQPHTEQVRPRGLHLASLLERLAECLMIQGAFSEAREHYERILGIRAQAMADGPIDGGAAAVSAQEPCVRALLCSEIARALRMTGSYGAAKQCCEEAAATLAAAGVGAGPALASLRLQESYIHWQEGHYASAHQVAQAALRLAEEMRRSESRASPSSIPTRISRVLEGGALLLGEIHEMLSNIASSQGQVAEALPHLAIALGLYEQLEDPRAIAHVTGNLGYTYLMRGEDTLARMHLARSFALAEQVGDSSVMAVAALNLGELAARSGVLQDAERWFKRSLVLTQQAGDLETEVWVRDSLAAAYRDQGKLVDALECLLAAVRLSRTIQNTPCLGLALVSLGQVRILQAQTADGAGRTRFLGLARTEVTRALAFEHLYAEPRTAGRLVLAQIALLSGDLQTAWQEATQALEEAQASDLVLLVGRAQRLLGAILAAQGDLEQADQRFEQALEVCRSHHMELERARTLHLYAEALLERCVGAISSAMVYYQRALNYLQEARGICATNHAALDFRQVELALQQAPNKKPFLGWF
jgi:tetratricopeptide (TPR) repeat protein